MEQDGSMASEINKGSVRAAASDSANEVAEASEDVAASASRGADQARGHLGKVADVASDLYAKGADRAQNAMDDLPASLSDASAAGERLVLQGRQRLDRGVRKQPVEALLLAGAIGYLVGWATIRG